MLLKRHCYTFYMIEHFNKNVFSVRFWDSDKGTLQTTSQVWFRTGSSKIDIRWSHRVSIKSYGKCKLFVVIFFSKNIYVYMHIYIIFVIVLNIILIYLLLSSKPSLSDSDDLDEMERLRKEHIEALRELKRMQVPPWQPFQTLSLECVTFIHVLLSEALINPICQNECANSAADSYEDLSSNRISWQNPRALIIRCCRNWQKWNRYATHSNTFFTL